ncbi:MAG: antibiotic biosynthesis monooxygenase [Melioribacter sp.]|nr:antibiotic biosynthesis monooxygenase [Melioribacter sp.]
MLTIIVNINVKPEYLTEFISATLKNVKNSLLEPGVIRFNFCENANEDNAFILIEVYKSKEAQLEHKMTPHYNEWREQVEKMMAKPRSSIVYKCDLLNQ